MFVDIKNINIGDILLESVQNLNGTILASKNSIIDEKILHYFNLWGIKRINIESAEHSNFSEKQNRDTKNYNINRIMNAILKTADEIKSERIVDII